MITFRDQHICINGFAELHGTTTPLPIFFAKVDFLHEVFNQLRLWGKDCIVISGNGDYCVGSQFHPIGEHLASMVPENVKKVFAQNCLIRKDHPNYYKFEIIPIGLENYIPCKQSIWGEGIPPNGVEKQKLLNRIDTSVIPEITDKLYSNFSVWTNPSHRQLLKNICTTSPHIVWQEPTLTSEQFYREVLKYEAIVCAQGNGPGDNHRIYEVLYLNRIPITFNVGMYEKLHKNFPVVCLEHETMLMDYSYIQRRIDQEKNKMWDRRLLCIDYWIEMIKNYRI
jgi:hypothetical protein